MKLEPFSRDRFKAIPIQIAFDELVEQINSLITAVNELDAQLSRIKKDRPDPRRISPYDLTGRKHK